jgi:hypothetical protein
MPLPISIGQQRYCETPFGRERTGQPMLPLRNARENQERQAKKDRVADQPHAHSAGPGARQIDERRQCAPGR